MNTRLYSKILKSDLEATLKAKGYAYFNKGMYNLNIIGIRSNNDNKVTNQFDDYMAIIYRSNTGRLTQCLFEITTEPGTYYISQKLLSPKGTAILVPSQYRGCWEIGKHQGKYNALVQKKPVKVYRDNNKDNIYDMNPDTIETGVFGINIHRSNEFVTSKQVDKWSAGCQVFANPSNFHAFMRLCKEQAKRYGNSFTYTLINEEDLI